jgi:hypothetical protein
MRLKLTILSLTLLIFSSMNIYSRALRHINIKDVKQKHQEKVVEKIQEEVRKKEERQYIQSVMETKKYDWRKELNEQMTTSDVFFTNLPATGDVNLDYPRLSSSGANNGTIDGSTITIGGDPSPFLTNGILLNFDSSFYDTLKFNVSNPSDNIIGFFIGNSGSPELVVTSSGTYILPVPQSGNLSVLIDTPDNPTITLSGFSFQRRTPLNVFASLDSPEATSFIRTDPMMSKLSPQERLKKLKDMFEASDEYVMKMLGLDFPGTGAVPPGEYDPFKQAPAGEAGDTPGVEISNFDTSKMEKDYGQIAGFDATYEMIKSGQVPFMKPPAARQLLLNPKYQKLWDDDPGALKTIQRLAV